jgi:hypothetical protein
MSHVKPPAKIGTPGCARMLATARRPSTEGKPITGGPPATATTAEGRQAISRMPEIVETSQHQ